MADLKQLLDSSNMLEDIISLDDDSLFEYFKDLSNLDFYLNAYGMSSKHEFTVIEHTKRLLKNFSLALKYRDNPDLMKMDLVGGTTYKKNFFNRIIKLLDDLNLETHSDDFKAIVLTLLLHDLGKGTYDKSDKEIKEQVKESKKKGRNFSFEYLTLYYKMKDHEERGAFMVYSLLEEVPGMEQSFAARVKNMIQGHGDFSKLQTEKDFNFFLFLRRIMEYATEYNFPFIQQENPTELLIHELRINYLVYLIDVYSVDDKGKVWHTVGQEKETVYLRAKWYLGKKLEDLLCIISENYSDWDDEKSKAIKSILKKNFLKSFRSNSNTSIENELSDYCTTNEKNKLMIFLEDFFEHSNTMFPLYLNDTSPMEKAIHINMFKEANGDLRYHFIPSQDRLTIHLVKRFAPEGSLLKIVQSIITSSIKCNRTIKIYKVHAFSGEDDRLVDRITVRHANGEIFTDEMQEALKENLDKINDPGYKIESIDLPISQEELDQRIATLEVELSEVEIGSRKFTMLKVIIPRPSNLTLYSCLNALSHINIIDVSLEEKNDSYCYSFLLSFRQTYSVASTSAFKRDIIEQLKLNVLVMA